MWGRSKRPTHGLEPSQLLPASVQTRELELRTSILLAKRSPCRFASAVDLANARVPAANLCESTSFKRMQP